MKHWGSEFKQSEQPSGTFANNLSNKLLKELQLILANNTLALTDKRFIKVESYTLLRSAKNPNEWYLFEEPQESDNEKIIGKGGAGTVYAAECKIIVGKISSEIMPIALSNSYVIKKQAIHDDDKKEQLKQINEENNYLKNQYIDVPDAIYLEEDKLHYTVIEHCGQSLDKFLKNLSNSTQMIQRRVDDQNVSVKLASDFLFRVEVALAILNEVNILWLQQKLAHRDIKPENICIRLNEDGSFKVFLIDFGISAKIGSVQSEQGFAGTLHYAAPELVGRNRQAPSVASDTYALAGVFYWLFAAIDPLQEKQKSRFSEEVSFSAEGLFSGLDLATVDLKLRQDLERFLAAMQDKDPKKRPSYEMMQTFFILIFQRAAALKEYQKNKTRLSLSVTEFSKIKQEQNKQSKENKKDFNVLKEQLEVLTETKPYLSSNDLPSHLETVKNLCDNKPQQKTYAEVINQDIESTIKKMGHIAALQSKMEHFLNTTAEVIAALVQKQFVTDRHDGIKALNTIANPNHQFFKDPLDKLIKIRATAQSKTEKSFSNWWKQLRIPGLKKGRDKKVHAIYQNIARLSESELRIINEHAYVSKISLYKVSNTLDEKAIRKLNDILDQQQITLGNIQAKKHSGQGRSSRQDTYNEEGCAFVEHMMKML